jgi:Flp pilus assembly protein TadD
MKIDDKSWKAHYQRGVAHNRLKNYDEATVDYKNAIKLNPQDKKLRAEFE